MAATEKYNGLITLPDKRIIEVGKMYPDIPNHVYYGSLGLGSTSLKNMHPEQMAPRLFQAYRDHEIEFEGSRGSRIGSTLHAMCFTPLTWEDEVRILPSFKRGNTAQERAEFIKAHPEYIWVNEEEKDTASSMYPVLMAHPAVSEMFAQINTVKNGVLAGGCEQSIWYNDVDPDTGEGTYKLCKYRPDMRYCPEWEMGYNTFIADLKVTVMGGAAADKFWRTISSLGYHISAAHYMTGEHVAFGRRPGTWRWIVQEYEAPYLVACYECEEDTLRYGMYLRRRAMNALVHAKKLNDWSHYSYNKPTKIGLPKYITSRMEN